MSPASFFRRLHAALRRRIRYRHYRAVARRESRANLQAVKGRNLLVICHGNIYRSPFVEKKLSSRLNNPKWNVRSVGFHDKAGRKCAESFVKLAQRFDVDLSTHISRQISSEDIEWADILVVMDSKNRDFLNEMPVLTGNKVVWAGAWLVDNEIELEDPYGKSDDDTEQIARRLATASDALADAIVAIET